MQIAIWLVVGVVCAVICGIVAKNKGRNPIGFALLGFVLPLIGVIVVLVIKPETT